MTVQHGGETFDGAHEPRDGLAPIIPIFGGANTTDQRPASVPIGARPGAVQRDDAPWHSTWVDSDGDDSDDDADEFDGDDGYDDCASIEREIAETNLLKKLGTRQLSVVEARAVIRERDVGASDVESILEHFVRRGYLDDAGLAEQLVHIAVDRKGQGRQVIARTLAKRGIPRDVADAALAELPDDDAERALEYARGKAESMARLDRDTAVRRLTGQLARRGYPGSVALNAARQALDESGATTGVRFR